MKYLKTYNEQVDFVKKYDDLDNQIYYLEKEYVDKVKSCIIYLSDLFKCDITIPSKSNGLYFGISFSAEGYDDINELVDLVKRSCQRLSDDLNAEDFSFSFGIKETETSSNNYSFDNIEELDQLLKVNQISKLNNPITKIRIYFK